MRKIYLLLALASMFMLAVAPVYATGSNGVGDDTSTDDQYEGNDGDDGRDGETDSAFVRVTSICQNDDGTVRYRILYEEDGPSNVPFTFGVNGSGLGSGVISPGEEQFFTVQGTNGVSVKLGDGVTNEYRGTASIPAKTCAEEDGTTPEPTEPEETNPEDTNPGTTVMEPPEGTTPDNGGTTVMEPPEETTSEPDTTMQEPTNETPDEPEDTSPEVTNPGGPSEEVPDENEPTTGQSEEDDSEETDKQENPQPAPEDSEGPETPDADGEVEAPNQRPDVYNNVSVSVKGQDVVIESDSETVVVPETYLADVAESYAETGNEETLVEESEALAVETGQPDKGALVAEGAREYPSISELPDTGGASLFTFGAGALLVAGALIARRFIR